MLVHGVKYTKLLNIPLDHIVVDELHLMLTVTDIFIGIWQNRNSINCGCNLDRVCRNLQNPQ